MRFSPSLPRAGGSNAVLSAMLALMVFLTVLVNPSHAAAVCKSSAEFSCPNCGGITVDDCSKCDGYMFTDNHYELCYDRKLFHVNGEEGNSDTHYPFLVNDLIGSIVFFFTAGFAIACGVGGGGLFVPLGILIVRFPPKNASGLSQAAIFGATLGGLIVNSRTHHPEEHFRDTIGIPSETTPGKIVGFEVGMGPAAIAADREQYLAGGDGKHKFYTRPIIDFDLALFLSPMEMAGALLGVVIQRVFPDWLFVTFAALVLGFTSYKTFGKFRVQYKKDIALKNTERELQLAETVAASRKNDDDNEVFNADDVHTEETLAKPQTEEDPKTLEKRRAFLEEDSRQFPAEKIVSLAVLWIGLTILTFLKGGKGVNSVIGITCKNPWYQVMTAIQFLWLFGYSAFYSFKNNKRAQDRIAVNYPFVESDQLWTFRGQRLFAFFSFLAGVIAGLIGIGGGMILGPLFMTMGVHPAVSTATTATMILLTSSSVAIMFVMNGLVPWEYALYFFFVCIGGAYFGKTRVNAFIKKTGMTSYIIAALATLIALAVVGCLVILFMKLASVDWCIDGFKPFCSVKKSHIDCPDRFLSEAEILFPY